ISPPGPPETRRSRPSVTRSTWPLRRTPTRPEPPQILPLLLTTWPAAGWALTHANGRYAMRIFGREPAVWLGLVAVAVQFLVAWGVDFSGEQQAGINAVATLVMGLAVAVASARDQIVPAASGRLVGVLQLAVALGFDLSQEKITAAGARLTAVVASWLRTEGRAPGGEDGTRVPKATVSTR